MKNRIIFTVAVLLSFAAKAQNSDTLYLPPDELSDTILGGLTPSNFPSGFLHDRLLQEDTVQGYITDYESNPVMEKSSDLFYGTLMELDRMSTGTTAEPFKVQELYEDASAEVGKHHFDSERTVIPLGVIDYNYHDLDVNQGLASQQLYFNGVVLTDMGSASAQLYSQKNVQMIAPMYDFVDLEDLSFIFKPEWTFVDSQQKQVANIQIQLGNQWVNIPFNTPFEVPLDYTATVQVYNVKVTYANQQVFGHTIKIHTPYLTMKSTGGFELVCDNNSGADVFEDSEGNKLGWCLVQSCKTQQIDPHNDLFHSPMILVTGYRPPVFGQKFARTWELYNDNHDDLLNTLRRHQFDIFMVRFNIHTKPKKHGMQESADLFIDFLDWVNANKADPYAENVIHASSMGSDIVRLSLMKMEHQHHTGTREHHHTRLLNSYDGNFYGANIPLAYQYMIKTSAVYPKAGTITALNLFLNATIRQKTVQELLTYHAYSGGLTAGHFASPILDVNVTPSHHQKRQDYLDALDLYDTGEHIVPLPTSPRNIAVSLGKIRGTNDQVASPNFNASNDPWRNIWIPFHRYYLSPGKYSATGYEKLYRNRGVRMAFYTIPFGIVHGIDVNAMQEVDNASGSYIEGFGNLVEVGDNAYWPLLLNGLKVATHKPVFTSLAIDKSLWPSNGTHTLDIQGLGLMYDSESNLLSASPSDHYGYPNLGRPSDHFDVTPFEAIYIDNKPNDHIDLIDDNATDRAILTNFLLKEYRPWVLGLQNDKLGSQARSSYTYRSRRIAKQAIHTGFNVTPTTDKGYYVVEPNADLILEAGNYIELRPGTYTELGARALIHIHYEECIELDPKSLNTNNASSQGVEEDNSEELVTQSIEDLIRLYPNPSYDGRFKIKVSGDNPIDAISVFDAKGNLKWNEEKIDMTSFYFERALEGGVYLIVVEMNGMSVIKRLVVL